MEKMITENAEHKSDNEVTPIQCGFTDSKFVKTRRGKFRAETVPMCDTKAYRGSIRIAILRLLLYRPVSGQTCSCQ